MALTQAIRATDELAVRSPGSQNGQKAQSPVIERVRSAGLEGPLQRTVDVQWRYAQHGSASPPDPGGAGTSVKTPEVVVTNSNHLVLTSDLQHRIAAAPGSFPFTPFAVAGYPAHGGMVVKLTGELDIATVPALNHVLRGLDARERAHVVVDLAELAFCDCAGLNALLKAHRQAIADGGWLRLCAGSSGIKKILEISGLSTELRCFPTVQDAFATSEPSPTVTTHR